MFGTILRDASIDILTDQDLFVDHCRCQDLDSFSSMKRYHFI